MLYFDDNKVYILIMFAEKYLNNVYRIRISNSEMKF